MTTRIAEAIAATLESARFYLARLPIGDQNLSVDPQTRQLTNEAIPILFAAECAVRLENSQN